MVRSSSEWGATGESGRRRGGQPGHNPSEGIALLSAIERIRTVTATCRCQGRARWGYLREAVEAFFFGRPAPPLVTEPLA